MTKIRIIIASLALAFTANVATASASTPYLSKGAAWDKTFHFAQQLGDRMDDGSYKDVIPLVEDGNGPSACTRVRRDAVDCDFSISFFPWSFDDRDAQECVDTLRIRKYKSGSIRVYLPAKATCTTI